MQDRDKGPSCSSRFGRCLESYVQVTEKSIR